MKRPKNYTAWDYVTPDGKFGGHVCNPDGAEFYMALAYNNRDGHTTNCVESPKDVDAAYAAGYRLARVRVSLLTIKRKPK